MARGLTTRGAFARLLNPATVALVAILVGLGVTLTPLWRTLELKIFDWLVVRNATHQVKLPITIVGIDEATFETLKTSWPLPRRYHAQLLDNLARAGAAVVGFDIAFPQLTTPQDDEPFLAAIQRAGHVVLAAEHAFREDYAVRHWSRVDPHAMFLLAGAGQGYASLEVDSDAVLRRVPVVSDAFWRTVLYEFDKLHPDVVESMDASDDMLIRYVGGPHTFTYVSYHHLLEPDKYLPSGWREYFRDNIVLVGRNVNVIQDVGASQAEMYQTPFFHRTREFMPRVEVHANLIANMVAGEALRRAPASWSLGIWLLAALAGLLFMRGWHPARSGVLLAVLAATLAALELLLFEQLGFWLPVAGAVMTLFLIYGSQGALAFLAEQRQRREIRNAFSMYVSPAVVDQVIAHPEQLKLGGERRELTILFSDLAGFTSIAERLDPEQVAALVNRHLSDMTDAVLAQSGTVDKFVGDGIMAFWGAPIADERQSERAVLAALEMQRRTEVLAAEVLAATGAVLRVRVGIHCGECVVGNMGGSNRFDYTVMGDAVNLASRLEGANKVYGTTILLSEAVAAKSGPKIRLREVDTVRVKGKQQKITVFTPCDKERLVALGARALSTYRSGDFLAAEETWNEVLAEFPEDAIARVYQARVNARRAAGVPPEWDGVTTLEDK